jgi:hypothetical protein
MNAAHLHLILNHIPTLSSIGGIALLAWGILRRNTSAVRIALVALVIAALFAVPTYLSGEGGEEILETAPAADHDAIEEHEEIGKIASYGIWVVGALSAIALWRHRRSPTGVPRGFSTAVLIGSIVVSALLIWTSLLGGVIVHSEIRGDPLHRALTEGTPTR